MNAVQVRAHLRSLAPYEPPDLEAIAARAGRRVEELVRLNANENPYGPSPRVGPALAACASFAHYPDERALRPALAAYAGVSPAQVVPGNGSNELIDLLLRLLLEPGQGVALCPPTFTMYRFFACLGGCAVREVPRRDDFSLDERALLSLGRTPGAPRLLFLASPGNPDGRAISPALVARLLQCPWTVVLDEAYIEFGGESALPLLAAHDNLVILRTLSKWAGLAGLRVGYALLSPALAAHLERIRAPYSVNAAAVAAVLATLQDLGTVRGNVAHLIAGRDWLQAALARIPWLTPLPSQANFILCRVHGGSGEALARALAERGILVRAFSEPRLRAYVRITVGRPEQNWALLAALVEMDAM